MLTVLQAGELTLEGRLVDASNATFYCRLELGGVGAHCVYKPVRGERPLWDFPEGTLAGREVATYLVSQATGWGLVPPTLLREGPYGPGMCQLWIEIDQTTDLVALVGSDHEDLRRLALLDAVVNNADRKGGHLLPTTEGRVLAIDHGVCFSVEDKLRTVLWQWRGMPLGEESLTVLAQLRDDLAGGLGEQLRVHLSTQEVQAITTRVERLLASGSYPLPSKDWPAIPWPPF